MAIRFVDVEPEGKVAGGKGKAGGRPIDPAPAPPPGPVAAPAATKDEPGSAVGGDAAPGLTLPKPEPKPRGRKKPMAAAAGAEPAPRPAAATDGAPPDADGLLPGLQLHAKPTPKPRGRKKAFG